MRRMKVPFVIGAALFASSVSLQAQSEGEIDHALGATVGTRESAVNESTAGLMKKGLRLLENLQVVLAGIDDKSSADRAAARIYKISAEFQSWGRQVSTLPPLSDEERDAMETTFLPAFKMINERLEALGQKLAAESYYLSRELYEALALFVQDTH